MGQPTRENSHYVGRMRRAARPRVRVEPAWQPHPGVASGRAGVPAVARIQSLSPARMVAATVGVGTATVSVPE